ncbi:MAG: hypothetical protein ABSB89_03135 [Candidatus Bathyarchaeia archaeon]
MKKNTFKIMIGLVIVVVGAIAAIGTFILQATLDSDFSDLNLNYIVPILYLLSLLFVLVGFYVIFETGALDKYLRDKIPKDNQEVQE